MLMRANSSKANREVNVKREKRIKSALTMKSVETQLLGQVQGRREKVSIYITLSQERVKRQTKQNKETKRKWCVSQEKRQQHLERKEEKEGERKGREKAVCVGNLHVLNGHSQQSPLSNSTHLNLSTISRNGLASTVLSTPLRKHHH